MFQIQMPYCRRRLKVRVVLLLSVAGAGLLGLVWHTFFWRTLLRSTVGSLKSCSDENSSAYLDNLVLPPFPVCVCVCVMVV